MEQKSNTFTQIYDIVRQIPYGKVATYGQIAELAGNKRLSRVVGYALHVNPDPDGIPCYRVVNRLRCGLFRPLHLGERTARSGFWKRKESK